MAHAASSCTPVETVGTRTAQAGRYLTFALGREEYGVPVLKVREIITSMDITSVPHAPPHVRGIINLRGRVVPIVDLRRRFGLPDATEATRVAIIVDARTHAGVQQVGLLVDQVSEVLQISANDVEPTPDFGDRIRTDFLAGVAKVGKTVRILIDLDCTFRGETLPEAA